MGRVASTILTQASKHPTTGLTMSVHRAHRPPTCNATERFFLFVRSGAAVSCVFYKYSAKRRYGITVVGGSVEGNYLDESLKFISAATRFHKH